MSESLPGESVPTCETCGANFANQNDLESHINAHHEEMEAAESGPEKQYKCQCGATFKSKDSLIEHERVVHRQVEAV